MKHFKRILCVLLSLLMTLPLAIASVGATETPDPPTVKPGTVLYAQDFEVEKASISMFPNTSTAYSGTYAFSGPADRFGQGGVRSAKFWREGSAPTTWAFPTICSAEDLQGQTHYTIKVNIYGEFNGGNYFGLRFGGYEDNSAKGHYVCFGYNYYLTSYYYDSAANRTWLGYNGSGENTGKAEREKYDAMTLAIDVDSANKVAKVYLQSSMHATLELVNTIPMQNNDISSIHFALMNTTADVEVDNILITAGGIEDVPTTAYGVQTTAVNEGKYDMRFVGAFNGNVANVQKVGFKVVANWNDGAAQTKTFDKNTNTVYSSIKAANGTRLVSATECGGDYLFALTVEEIPTEYPVTFTMTSYVITSNGSTVYGATKTVVATYEGGELKVTPVENVISPEA